MVSASIEVWVQLLCFGLPVRIFGVLSRVLEGLLKRGLTGRGLRYKHILKMVQLFQVGLRQGSLLCIAFRLQRCLAFGLTSHL